MIPQTKIIHKEEAEDRRNYYVSFGRIRESLNFSVKKTVKDSVQEIREAIKNGKILHYKDPKYNNYIFLNSSPNSRIKPLDVV